MELLEREARPLDDDVVDRRFETRGRGAGDVVGDLLECVAHGETRRDLGDREAGRLRCERRGARHARVHLDHDDLAGLRVHRELHVRPAGFDAHRADHRDRLVAQQLVGVVTEALLRCDGDRIAGVDPHRVDVLDRADDHDVVVAVAHHLELELTPAEHRLLDEHLADRRRGDASGDDSLIVGTGVRDAATLAAEREGGAHDRRQAEPFERVERFADGRCDGAARNPQPGGEHRLAKQVAILRAADRLIVGANQLNAVALQRAVLMQRLGEVQRRLTAERREQRVRLLARDDLRDRPGQQRLDVGHGRELGVGHDRRRVRVDEHHLVALFREDLAGLCSRVVELGCLPDDDRARAEDHYPADVLAARHQARISPMNRSKRCSASCGPGPASG